MKTKVSSVLILFLAVLITLTFSPLMDSVSAYQRPVTLQDYEPAQLHRSLVLTEFGFQIVSNTTSNLLTVKGFYDNGYYTFTHDEWSSIVNPPTGYTDNFSFGKSVEYHYGSLKFTSNNRYPLCVMYPSDAILLCNSQADNNITLPSGGYIEAIVQGRFIGSSDYTPMDSGGFEATSIINF